MLPLATLKYQDQAMERLSNMLNKFTDGWKAREESNMEGVKSLVR